MAHAKTIEALVELAQRADGIVARRQLLAAGIDDRSVERLLGSGLLRPVFPGVYLYGVRSLSQRQLFRAALVATGPESWLCGYSSAEHRRLLRPRPGVVFVATARPRAARRRKAHVPMEDGREATVFVRPGCKTRHGVHDDLPVSTMAATLIDVGRSHGARYAGWAWREADYRGQLDLAELHAELAATRRRGAHVLRDLLATLPAPVEPGLDIRSASEIDFLALVASAGLPRPEVNVVMSVGDARYVADFYWPDLGLVAEVDDPSHRRQVAIGRDRVRDLDFFIAELDVIRFETHRLERSPERCMEQLKAAIARQRRRTDLRSPDAVTGR